MTSGDVRDVRNGVTFGSYDVTYARHLSSSLFSSSLLTIVELLGELYEKRHCAFVVQLSSYKRFDDPPPLLFDQVSSNIVDAGGGDLLPEIQVLLVGLHGLIHRASTAVQLLIHFFELGVDLSSLLVRLFAVLVELFIVDIQL